MVFATIAADSQRLPNTTDHAFVQNLMHHLPRPDVGTIDGLPASIVVDHAPTGVNPRSTVGTATGAWTSLRRLYATRGPTGFRTSSTVVQHPRHPRRPRRTRARSPSRTFCGLSVLEGVRPTR